MAGRSYSLRLIVYQDIDNAVAMLHAGRTNLLGLEDAQATALHHRRAAHADVAALGGNDDVTAAQQRGIAGKAAPGHDAHHRHLAVEPRIAGKGGHVQARDDGHVHIPRPAPAAFGKQHHGQLVVQRDAQHAVGLLVVAHALGARQYGGVIGHGDNLLAVDLAQPGDHAIGGGVLYQVFFGAAAALRGYRQRTVFNKSVSIAQVCNVFAGAAQAQGVALGYGVGAAGVLGTCHARLQLVQIGAWRHWGVRCCRFNNVLHRIILNVFGL